MAPDFGQVIEALREAGVTAHFTMGGHYASFEPTEILVACRDWIPSSDLTAK